MLESQLSVEYRFLVYPTSDTIDVSLPECSILATKVARESLRVP